MNKIVIKDLWGNLVAVDLDNDAPKCDHGEPLEGECKACNDEDILRQEWLNNPDLLLF